MIQWYWPHVLQMNVFWAHKQAVSQVGRKNSQLNKRRPPARPTHSTGSHAWTWDHTHTHTHLSMHILNSLRPWCSITTHISPLLFPMSTDTRVIFSFSLSIFLIHHLINLALTLLLSSSLWMAFSPATALIVLGEKSTAFPPRYNPFYSVNILLKVRSTSQEEQTE